MPLLDRAGPQAVDREVDRPRQVALFARGIREIMARVGALFWVMRVAAATEPEIATLLHDLLERRQDMAFFVVALQRTGPLQAGLDAAWAADSVWALASPEVHRLLTVEHGINGCHSICSSTPQRPCGYRPTGSPGSGRMGW